MTVIQCCRGERKRWLSIELSRSLLRHVYLSRRAVTLVAITTTAVTIMLVTLASVHHCPRWRATVTTGQLHVAIWYRERFNASRADSIVPSWRGFPPPASLHTLSLPLSLFHVPCTKERCFGHSLNGFWLTGNEIGCCSGHTQFYWNVNADFLTSSMEYFPLLTAA